MSGPDDEGIKHPSIRISFVCMIKRRDVENTRKFHYELEHFYPGVERAKFWDLFVDHEAWSESEFLLGKITIVKPGEGHPQGWAVC